MSAEIVALLVLVGGAVAALAFTLLVVVMVDLSAGTRPPHGDDGAREQEDHKR